MAHLGHQTIVKMVGLPPREQARFHNLKPRMAKPWILIPNTGMGQRHVASRALTRKTKCKFLLEETPPTSSMHSWMRQLEQSENMVLQSQNHPT